MQNGVGISRVFALGLVAMIGVCGIMSTAFRPTAATTDRTSGFQEVGHPVSFQYVLELAKAAQEKITANIRDYSAVMRKRERISGTLPDEPTFMFIKIREKPFSVFLHFLGPKEKVGNEALYVEGRNKGYLLGHGTGLEGKLFGTVYLPPEGLVAMHGEMYPIMRIGLGQLCNQLIEFAGKVPDPSKVKVLQFDRARVNDRACTLLKLVIPVVEPGVRGYLVRIFIDKELGLPICLEVYKLLLDRKAPPQLFQEYIYLNLKINRGYGDIDFDKKNPQYTFP